MEASEWTPEEITARGNLKQRMREKPGDRHAMIALATLLASKMEVEPAVDLLDKAAVGAQEDADPAGLLRKVAGAKLAVWRAMRVAPEPFNQPPKRPAKKRQPKRKTPKPGAPPSEPPPPPPEVPAWPDPAARLYADCGSERFAVAQSAAEAYEDAMAQPANGGSPAALVEAAQAKLAVRDLAGALKDFSSVVANFPAYPQLNGVIFRAACLLALVGDRSQAVQYLAYVLGKPPLPTDAGGGELECRALLLICSTEPGPGRVSPEAAKKLYGAFQDALKRHRAAAGAGAGGGGGGVDAAQALPPGFPVEPPEGTPLAKWAAPWRLLADRALARCDYVAAAEFLRTLLKKDKTDPATLVRMGQVRHLLGDQARAMEAMEAAHAVEPAFPPAAHHLLAWDPDTWAPRLDKAEAARKARLLREAAERARLAAVERRGRVLRNHKDRVRAGQALETWYCIWERHFAVTAIARVARGVAARALAARLSADAKQLAANTKLVVQAIHAHLLRHVLECWHAHRLDMAAARRRAAQPLLRRLNAKFLRHVTALWRQRARKQAVGKRSARRALQGMHKWVGKPPHRVKIDAHEEPIFYAEPLQALAAFPRHKAHHEACVGQVQEEKARARELVEAAELAQRREARAAAFTAKKQGQGGRVAPEF